MLAAIRRASLRNDSAISPLIYVNAALSLTA